MFSLNTLSRFVIQILFLLGMSDGVEMSEREIVRQAGWVGDAVKRERLWETLGQTGRKGG